MNLSSVLQFISTLFSGISQNPIAVSIATGLVALVIAGIYFFAKDQIQSWLQAGSNQANQNAPTQFENQDGQANSQASDSAGEGRGNLTGNSK